MSEKKKPDYRKRHLFARSLEDVVKSATKPMMDKQGKIYGALLANWREIVGVERAAITRPGRLQFPAKEASGATLHLNVHPAHAPELQYAHEQIIEQCARWFGYRAVTRIIVHPAHDMAKESPSENAPTTRSADGAPPAYPNSMAELLQRMKSRIKTTTQ